MREREIYVRPKTPDILTKPFNEGVHPYTMMFLFLAYQEGAHTYFKDDLQRKLFDLYFTSDLSIEGQKDISGRINLEKEIREGFAILRQNASNKLNDLFTEKRVVYFKKSDMNFVSNTEEERKKYAFVNRSISHKKAKSEAQIKKMKETTKKFWQNPENRKKITEALKIAANRPETIEKKRKTQKKLWESPEFREKVQKSLLSAKRKEATPEVKKIRSERARKNWENPEYRIKRDNSRRLALENPELIQRFSDATINLWKDPQYRARVLESRKKTYEARKKAKQQE